MSLQATSQGLLTPIVEAPPVQPYEHEADYDDYGEEEDIPVIRDDNSSDSEQSVIAQTNQPTQRAAALPKQPMKIFQHLKPPMLLREEPVWLREVIEATPVFCGLLSLTSTKGIGFGNERLRTFKVSDYIHYTI